MHKNLHIAIISIHSSPIGKLGTMDTGGMSVYIREVSKEIAQMGHRVDIFTQSSDNRNETIHLNPNVRIIYLSVDSEKQIPKSDIQAYIPNFYNEIEQFRARETIRYHFIYSHYWLSGMLGLTAQHFWNIPHYIMFHTLGIVKNLTGAGEIESDRRIDGEIHLCNLCHRLIVPTEREKYHLLRYYNAPRDSISVIPCGVNTALFRPIDTHMAREKLGFREDEAIILFVGRFASLKGIERLLQAMFCLKHLRKIRLVLVGGDGDASPEFRNLKQMTVSLDISDNVTFSGRAKHEALPFYYNAADAIVIPSDYESFGLVALESLACGTPVLATPVGVMESIIRNGANGAILTDKSPHAIAHQIQNIIESQRSGWFKKELIRSSINEYSWKKVAERILDEYKPLNCRSG